MKQARTCDGLGTLSILHTDHTQNNVTEERTDEVDDEDEPDTVVDELVDFLFTHLNPFLDQGQTLCKRPSPLFISSYQLCKPVVPDHSPDQYANSVAA